MSRPLPSLLPLLLFVSLFVPASDVRGQSGGEGDGDGPRLRGPARSGAYVDAIGRAAAWLGDEQGRMEAWIWPWKLGHDLDLAVRTGEVGGEVPLGPLAREVTVRPWSVEITYVHSRFRIRQTLFAHASEPLLFARFEVDTSLDLTLVVSFVPDLAPMWPAGMGGQYAFFDAAVGGFVLSESRRQVNGVLGSPEGARGVEAPAHQLAQAVAFEIPVTRRRAAEGPVLLVATAGSEPREETIARWQSAVAAPADPLEERQVTWAADPVPVLQVPDVELADAWTWSIASLRDGLQFSPGLGTGLVAGFGPTGAGYRPGFSWYFGGDTSINTFGLVAAGQGDVLRTSFPFLEGFQREDGKMMHELTRSAPLLDWFGDYPYAYIHGDTTPFYVVALADYVRWTGDVAILEDSWPHLLSAHRFGCWADDDGDGLMDNTRAGLGASELGSLREGLKTGVFIATVWTRALADLAYLAPLARDSGRAEGFRSEHQRAKDRLQELFIDRATGTLNFGVAVSGEPKNDVTAWAAFPIVFGLVEGPAAERTLDLLASARLSTDWGVRMLAEDSPFYDPVGYNNGAVWPFLTGYAAMAEFAAGRRQAGYLHLQQTAHNTFIDARGRHPEVMSGDYFTALETSVPHQLFSSSPIPANLVRGVLGLEPDLPSRRIAVRPQLPGGWRRAALHGLPLPEGGTLGMVLTRRRSEGRVVYRLEVTGPPGLEVDFAPRPAPLEVLDETSVSGLLGSSGMLSLTCEGTEGCDLVLDRIAWREGEGGEWRHRPREGDPPTGLRVVRVTDIDARTVGLVLEGRVGYTYRVPLEGRPVRMAEGAGIVVGLSRAEGEGYEILILEVGPADGIPVGVDDYRRFRIRIEVD